MPKWPLEKVLAKLRDVENGVLRVDMSSPRVRAAIEQGKRIVLSEVAGVRPGNVEGPMVDKATPPLQDSESDPPPPGMSRPGSPSE